MSENDESSTLGNNKTTDTAQIRQVLLQKTWFGFDLDDTLHEFRKASSTASRATLHLISTKHNIPLSSLEKTYTTILSQKTAHAFTDGKTSDEYRKERFTAVLNILALPNPPEFLNKLTSTYKSTLKQNLALKPGAKNLLTYLQSLNKNIVIITEGPQDAQEWTLSVLELASKVDFLATTNQFGVSKTEGLFEKVMERLGIEGEEMVFVGDSLERDVEPARRSGVLTIHYCEGKEMEFCGEMVRIGGLGQLEELLRG